MNEDEERFIRVSIGMLALQLRELVTHVGAISAALRGSADSEVTKTYLAGIESDLLELDASVLRLADAFPPEIPGSGNGKRLH